jgi:hypothetical protein
VDAPKLPFNLGQAVRRRKGPTDSVGLVVGILFGAVDSALVRWQEGESSFEPLDSLVTVFE